MHRPPTVLRWRFGWSQSIGFSRRPALIAALLPEWGRERRPLFEHWLPAQTVRPIDEVLEELGFE